ncbi:MAG TPA: GNAT family N-acetyltransferase [Vicinamibacterales bacterium]|nr:GNAT family N-acetyltransferase [Vicinamibacterales bacterium]
MNDFVIRTGQPADAAALHALICRHQTEGHLLPRDFTDVERHVTQFVVCEADGAIQACAELAPLSTTVAEVRSLVVSSDFRRVGVAARLIGEVRRRAEAAGFDTLCAFTHDARFFVRQNFSIVPHLWLPGKIAKDCVGCSLFRHCSQHAMVLPLKKAARYGSSPVERRRVAVA